MKYERENIPNIIIDIENIDTKAITEQEKLLQEEAYTKLRYLLEENINISVIKNKEIIEQRTHNTVFVHGKRGSGKTQFLLSIKNHLKDIDKELSKKFYFFRPIDPTLLHANESFLTIIIAKVLNNLEQSGKINNLSKQQKKKFYKNLNNVAEAIDGVFSNKEKTALEVIAQDQTSLRLEQYAHEFFKNISKIVDRDKLVLLIDDVDMAFDKGFEVLEVIRKYLTSPYVMPIVTGDIGLYQIIVNDNFSKKIINKDLEGKKIGWITTDYLIKIFPTNKRIELKDLCALYYDKYKAINEISFEGSKYHDNISDFFSSMLEKKEFGVTEGGSFDKFKQNILENSLRRLVQFFNAKKDKELFGLVTIEQIKKIEKDYFLNILTDVESYDTFLQSGKDLLAKGDAINAEIYFNKALKSATNDEEKATAYFYLGNTFDKLEKYGRAIEYYNLSIEYGEYNDTVYFSIGNAYYNIEKYTEAIVNYKEALDINLKNKLAHFNLALSYKKEKNYEESIEAYEKLINIFPDFYDAYIELGSIYSDIFEDYDKAKALFKKAININNEDENAYINLGNVYFNTKDYENAIIEYKAAVELNSDNSDVYDSLGSLYDKIGDNDKSINAYLQAIKINPKNDIVYFRLGVKYLELNRYDEAIKMYKKFIEIDDTKFDSYNNLGYIYIQIKDYINAKIMLKKAIEIQPSDFQPYINLITISLITNEFDEYDFVSRFNDNLSAMKFYMILKILHSASQGIYTDSDMTNWTYIYENVDNEILIKLDNIKEWSSSQKYKEKLLEYIEVFEQYIYAKK